MRKLGPDQRGVVTVVFAMAALAVIMAVGSGIDLTRAYFARQQISAIATLTCQYANRPTVVYLAFGIGGVASYIDAVNSYSVLAQGYQNVSWRETTPFTATLGGAGTVTLTTSVSTLMMKIIGITSLPVNVSLQCFSIPASTPQQPMADATATMLVQEGFENSANLHLAWYLPGGTNEGYEHGVAIPLVTTAPTNAGYVGLNGNEWIVMGYCLEVDTVGKVISSVPEGTHHAELDCDNGSGTAGNSSISTKVYMTAGTSYELRYYYDAVIYNNYYGTSYICGTSATDTYWATDTSYSGSYGEQTNQVNFYLDQNTTGSPPTHTTLYGSQTLAGTNLIDECVCSDGWIERRVSIAVTTSGYYWLSLAADGANDSYGGLIDDVRLCVSSCSGTVADNFPTSRLPASSAGGVLFEDYFDSPAYTYTLSYQPYSVGVLGSSEGTSSVWDLAGKGWGNPTDNRALYFLSGCPEPNTSHTQCINLGWSQNQSMARPFLLVPGYYRISYYYASQLTFSVLSSTAVYCGATPSDAGVYPTLTGAGDADGINRVTGTDQGSQSVATGSVGVFMAHAQMASEPITSTSLGTATTYTSPSGATESSPAVSPDDISLTSYTAPTVSALLDICGYATTKQLRTADVSIQKPALYWLIISTLGTRTSGYGAQIDDVKITALGSPSMTGAPSSASKIPMPDPQPDATITYTGFTITSKPY